MNEDNFFKRIFDSLVSKTIFALLAVIGTGVTVYAFLQEKKVDLRYEVIANTNVLDFNADIGKLEVTYDSTNLKQTNENLRIFTVKITNNGDKDILKEYYDENDPIGIKVTTGKIIDNPELIKASSAYLANNIKFKNHNRDRIDFSNVIIEPGEFYILKLLVLHKIDSIPNLLSYGKIAGQKEISVINSIDAKNKTNFWIETYQGNIWVQLMRLISYFIVLLLIIILSVTTSESIDTYKEKKRKEKLIKEFKIVKAYQYTRMDDAIFDRFNDSGSSYLRKMHSLLKDENDLNNIYNKLSKGLKSKEYRRFRRIEDSSIKYHYENDSWTVINEMISDGVIIKDKTKLSVNLAMKETIDKFIDFLKQKKELVEYVEIGDVEIGDIEYYDEDNDYVEKVEHKTPNA